MRVAPEEEALSPAVKIFKPRCTLDAARYLH